MRRHGATPYSRAHGAIIVWVLPTWEGTVTQELPMRCAECGEMTRRVKGLSICPRHGDVTLAAADVAALQWSERPVESPLREAREQVTELVRAQYHRAAQMLMREAEFSAEPLFQDMLNTLNDLCREAPELSARFAPMLARTLRPLSFVLARNGET